AGLRGASAWSAVAWLSLLYGLVTAVLLVLGRLLGDRTWWLYVANLTVVYWLAPSVVVAVVALLRRWWLVAMACVVGAVVWLGTFGPMFVPQQAPTTTDTLRVATYNISPQRDVDHVARLVDRTRADVLLIQEVLPEAQDTLIGSLPTLPYHHFAPVNARAPGGGGTAVFSRLPITATRPVTGLPSNSRPTDLVTLDTGRGAVTVVSLHLTSPCAACQRSADATPWRSALEDEARTRQVEVERVAAALPAGPLVVGGDLNSSTFNVPRRRLLATGLTDLHRAAGSGPGFTRFRWHGLVRIDWLLASRDITAVREWVERRDGSDHRAVVTDVAVPG
ncbi:MAG TPA: endonuclease/exonuclease/phosphatase family protein, partial [Euzebyales bacterium]|nr:endonuclease/exonuclease/phosphatase family protein [Euzebyales bacterium]